VSLPVGWKSVSLTSLGEIFNGGTPDTKNPDFWNGEIPWVTGADITSLLVSKGRKYITEIGLKNSATHLVPKDSILIVTRTGVGKVGVAENDLCFSQDITALVCSNDVNPFYVARFLSFIGERLKRFERGATIKGIARDVLDSIKVPMPSLETQNEIVSIIDKAEALKKSRKQTDKLMNQLLQSVFLEMFGDPAKNEKHWKKVKLSAIAEIEKRQLNPENIIDGTKYIGLEHIESNTGKITKTVVVSENELKSSKFKFSSKHVLYGKLRPYLNKIALPDFEGVCSTDILPILPIENVSNRYFIAFLLKHPYYIKLATELSSGANLPRISPKQIEKFEVYYPDFCLQQYFANIIKQINFMQEIQKQSQQEIDNLFDTFMQKAFTGALVI